MYLVQCQCALQSNQIFKALNFNNLSCNRWQSLKYLMTLNKRSRLLALCSHRWWFNHGMTPLIFYLIPHVVPGRCEDNPSDLEHLPFSVQNSSFWDLMVRPSPGASQDAVYKLREGAIYVVPLISNYGIPGIPHYEIDRNSCSSSAECKVLHI